MKRILFIGDVVGKAGCNFVSAKLGMIKQHYGVDITVINGENSAQGNGISRASAQQLVRAGADVITTGNTLSAEKTILISLRRIILSVRQTIRRAAVSAGAPALSIWERIRLRS